MPRLYRDTHATFEDYVEQRWACHDRRPTGSSTPGRWPSVCPPWGTNANKRQIRELLPLASRHGHDAAVTVYRTIAETDGIQVTAALLHGAVSILPPGRFDPAEVVEQIRATSPGTSANQARHNASAVEAFTAQTEKMLRALQRAASRGTPAGRRGPEPYAARPPAF